MFLIVLLLLVIAYIFYRVFTKNNIPFDPLFESEFKKIEFVNAKDSEKWKKPLFESYQGWYDLNRSHHGERYPQEKAKKEAFESAISFTLDHYEHYDGRYLPSEKVKRIPKNRKKVFYEKKWRLLPEVVKSKKKKKDYHGTSVECKTCKYTWEVRKLIGLPARCVKCGGKEIVVKIWNVDYGVYPEG